ncbi:hypothetical protein F0Q45_03325 [Mycobacterium simiae]|uniref:Guanylate cyclase domain-containing protein n=1 Tax=Mycobacterium simiae TaxID=1784 RepID=A0A5B1BV86_MYCSI|nr:hypothetical protein F0Q45_03325 [Mycobacterium simiae]
MQLAGQGVIIGSVTELFADVVRAVDIALVTVDPERLCEILADLARRAAVVVRRYGGTVDRFTGDGIMTMRCACPRADAESH